MKWLFHPIAVLAACTASLCGPPALAEGTSFARLSDLRFSTLDLTPNDGIAAGYSILSMEPSHLVASYYANGPIDWQDFPVDPYQPGTARVDFGPSFAEASTTGTIGDVSAHTHATPNLTGVGSVWGRATQLVWLAVQPNTVLMLGGHVDTIAEAWQDQLNYRASPYAQVKLMDEDGIMVTTMTRFSNVYGGHEEVHDDFVLAYANGSADVMTVGLSFAAQSSVHAGAPVPEPASWAMLCGGLFLLGVTTRHRRRH